MRQFLKFLVLGIILLLSAFIGANIHTLSAAPGINPIPQPTVDCTAVKNNEFHSLRPYQASVCNTNYTTALYCGNSIFLTDTFKVDESGDATPSAPGSSVVSLNCVDDTGDGVKRCDYVLNRTKTFSIDLRDIEIPIAGNTEDMRNYPNSAIPPKEAIYDGQKINEYVSWYLNGVPNAVEYGHIQPIEGTVAQASPFPKNIGSQIDMSGPLNKLLPQRIQQELRGQQVKNAVSSKANTASGIDQRHDQIVGCTRKKLEQINYYIFNFTKTVDITIPCNTDFWDSLWNGFLKESHRLTEWNGQLPPAEETYQNQTFLDYWQDYKEWRGNICVPITISSVKFLICVNPGITPFNTQPYIAQLFSLLPYTSTEDTIGRVEVEQAPLPLNQSDPITVQNEKVTQASEDIYVPHMAEDYQLAHSLQQTFVSQDLDLNAPADATTTVGDEFCNVVEVKSNPGDSVFGETLDPTLTYDAKFTCEFPLGSSGNCDIPDPNDPTGIGVVAGKCYPDGYSGCSLQGGSGCGGGYKCGVGCDAPKVDECEFTTEHSIPVYTQTPYLDDIWAKLVAGPSSVFKHIFPKIGTDGVLSELLDAPSASSTTYTTTNLGTNISAANTRPGASAELYFPHLGGIHEYFLECIQTALRPQGQGRECGDFNTAISGVGLAGNVVGNFSINAPGSKLPQIRGINTTVNVTSNPNNQASFWTKDEQVDAFSASIGLGSARSNTDYGSSVGLTISNGIPYMAWMDDNKIVMRKDTTGPLRLVYNYGNNSNDKLFIARIAVASNGKIFVIWNGPNGTVQYSVSNDTEGTSWSSVKDVLGDKNIGSSPPSIAAGDGGQVIVAFTKQGFKGIVAGIWNGSGFTKETVANGNGFADPKVAIAPNGNTYVAWREANKGPHIAERGAGTWTSTYLGTQGPQYGTPGLAADTNSGLHLFWVQVDKNAYYRYKPASAGWSTITKIPNTTFIANGDISTTSGGAYAHAVAEEFITNNSLPRIKYFRIKTGATSGGPITGGPTGPVGPTPPVGGSCTLSDAQIRAQIASWLLPDPDNGAQTAFNTINTKGSPANWSARSILAGERIASSKGFPVIQYLTGTWIWFESASGYPNLYAINCDDRGAIESQVSMYCDMNPGQVIGPRGQDFQFQIAGYQAMESNKDYRGTFARLYSPSELGQKLSEAASNSISNASKPGWKYQTGNGSGLLRFLNDISSATMNDLSTKGSTMVTNIDAITDPNQKEAALRTQFFSLLAGKDPGMVAAFNSIAVSNGDLVGKLKNPNCNAYYCSPANRQRLSNYVYALWKLDCTP